MTGLSLPLYATTTGGRTPDPYCPACLDRWQYGVSELHRGRVHPTCRDALDRPISTTSGELP